MNDPKKAIESSHQIDRLEKAAYSGRLARRGFFQSLVSLGVSVGVATSMADKAAAAGNNQRRLRECLRKKYDFIIIGAGSAGCVLADRLSSMDCSVLLLEGGGSDIEQPKVSDAARWIENLGSDTTWKFPMAPQPGFLQRPFVAEGGRVLGGTGSINAMYWLRGDYRDWREWQRLVGGKWTIPRLHRAQKRTAHLAYAGEDETQGKIAIHRYADQNPMVTAAIEGAGELGARQVEHNRVLLTNGVGYADMNILPNGRRNAPVHAYLLPAMHRPNLTVLDNTLVTQLLLHGDRCRGVQAVVDGELHEFRAGEVLLCAGALGSPSMLMRSGIGPQAVLDEAGVPLRHHLPAVGENLHDHVIVGGLYKTGPLLSNQVTLGAVGANWFENFGGVLDAPNVQLTVHQGPFPPVPELAGIPTLTILPWLTKVKSRGRLRILSADDPSAIHVDPAYFSDAGDVDTLVSALELAQQWANTDSLIPYAGVQLGPDVPESPEGKRAYLAAASASAYHYAGTCSAGNDPEISVVDSNFRVWGIDGLRVVDASVIPDLPGVNPQSNVLTLAELAAESLGFRPWKKLGWER